MAFFKFIHGIIVFFLGMILTGSCNQKKERQESADICVQELDTLAGSNRPVRDLLKRKHRPLHLCITNLAEGSGPVRIGVFNDNGDFPNGNDKLKSYKFNPINGGINVNIDDLEYGDYAFAVYHDANDNGEIDKNGLGIPTEPYGFSNNVKPVLKAPRFDQCQFTYNSKNCKVEISLIQKKNSD